MEPLSTLVKWWCICHLPFWRSWAKTMAITDDVISCTEYWSELNLVADWCIFLYSLQSIFFYSTYLLIWNTLFSDKRYICLVFCNKKNLFYSYSLSYLYYCSPHIVNTVRLLFASLLITSSFGFVQRCSHMPNNILLCFPHFVVLKCQCNLCTVFTIVRMCMSFLRLTVKFYSFVHNNFWKSQ